MGATDVSKGDQSEKRNDILVLFDVDGTITPAQQCIEEEMDAFLEKLRTRVFVGLVGGSDLAKISKQTLPANLRLKIENSVEVCINRYDYVFAENGLVAYKDGSLLAKQNIINHIGEEKLQKFINFCLAYMSTLQLPVKRGNFIDFRNGMINISPVGRSCSQSEREEFNEYDKQHRIREKFIEQLKDKFGPNSAEPIGLTYSIGGQISFDAFPHGWDKTFCLDMVSESFKEIHFFGDKTHPGGNDHEIFVDSRTIGHSVSCPSDTIKQLKLLAL